ncbi:MAG: dihydropteroate synthase [Planctomycetia bacterium]|nr:dihydropteroate synthase [Planctomycetia bacterium]
MSIQGLNIIGESINDSVPSTHQFYEENQWDSISELAHFQEENGAAYLDVNVGTRPLEVMQKAVETVLTASKLPLSIDSPDYDIAKTGLNCYDSKRGKPILNSISPLRTQMFDLYSILPFRPILLISEFLDENGNGQPCRTADETFQAAQQLFNKAKEYGIPNEDMIFDPGIAPIGTDFEGNLARLIGALKKIQDTPEMNGVHASVGLSNFTVMLPARTKSGELVKGPLESAFLTIAMPLGLDFVIGSVKRHYELLEADHPAMQCVSDCIKLGGFESLSRVRQFYK